MDSAWNAAACAFDLRMSGMADEDDLEAALGIASAFLVDFCDQWTRRVDDVKHAPVGIRVDLLGHAVGAEDRDRARRDIVQFLDEHRALRAQVVDDALVVDYFVTDIDRRPELLERALDDLDCALDAGAEAARLGKNNA